MKNRINKKGEARYNPNDPSIWYNNKALRNKVEKIQRIFGKPFLIAKDGSMLYEDSVVIPAFRDGGPDE